MLGHDLICAMIASGAGRVVVLASPQQAEDWIALHAQAELAQTFMASLAMAMSARVEVLVEADPDAVESHLYDTPQPAPVSAQPFLPIGSKRDIARMAISKLHEGGGSEAELIALPDSAPYGRVNVDTDACTLCLACVGACPTGACWTARTRCNCASSSRTACNAASARAPARRPRSRWSRATTSGTRQGSPIVFNEDEPYACVRCGKPFGSKKAIDNIIAKLEGKHWMFSSAASDRTAENVRGLPRRGDGEIEQDDPFKMGEVPTRAHDRGLHHGAGRQRQEP